MNAGRYRHRPPPRGQRVRSRPGAADRSGRVRFDTVTGAGGRVPHSADGDDGDDSADTEWNPIPPPAPRPPRPAAATPDHGPPGPRLRRTEWFHWALLGAIVLTGLVLRLRDPLESAVLATEDPYRHMERTWDLVQGRGVEDYPPGLMLLLSILTVFGAGVFDTVARFGPPLLGALAPLAMFLLLREWLHPGGALAGAAATAVAPEMIRRTNLLFPTTLDLVLLPIILLLVLRASQGEKRYLAYAGGLTLVVLVTHPWALVLIVPPVLVYWVVTAARGPVMRVAAPSGIFALGLMVFVFIRPSRAAGRIFEHALPRLRDLVADPATLTPLPAFVDFTGMLTVPLLALGAVGTVVALRRRDPFSLLALLVTFMLLPITLVDWFGFWFVPHRAIVFMGIGVTMLAALAVSALFERVEQRRPRSSKAATAGVVTVLVVLMFPSALAMEPWYRLYDEDDRDAWLTVAEDEPSLVVFGSWQGRVGYRGLTGEWASYDEVFFRYEGARKQTMRMYPDLVVIVDGYARENEVPTEFLQDWQHVGTWGDTEAYRPPVPSSDT